MCLVVSPHISFSKNKGEAGNSLSDQLRHISPFSDIVVIQRRYLMKTARFEFSPSAQVFFNNELFINAGVGFSTSFYFLEKHGIELKTFYAEQFNRRAALDILDKLHLESSAFGYKTNYFVGLAYKWIPIYGKMAWFNQRIIPFEMFFFAGGGMTHAVCPVTEDEKGSLRVRDPSCEPAGGNLKIYERWSPTILFGLGQSYAVSRNQAIRLDVSWQYYGSAIDFSGTSDQDHWDVYLALAFNFYLPRSKVR